MSTSLAQHHIHCYQAFTRISAEVPVSTAHHDSLQDQFDKYKLWAGNVGAAHSGKTYQLSLDYRLREAPFYKEQACKLLQILARQTNKTADILGGSRTPFEQRLPGSDSDTTSCTSPVEEDSPWEFSSDSEAEVGKAADQPSSSQSISPPEGLAENHSQGNSNLLQSPAIKELDQLLESIQVTVTCLYKLPLRKPASIDRLGDQTIQDVLCFHPFDALYIQEKFPNLHPEVSTRLAKMITRRRQLLLYRTKHRDRLRTDATAPAPQAMSYTEQETSKRHMEPRPSASSAAASLRESNRTTLKSKATTLRLEDKEEIGVDKLLAPSVAESDSRTSVVASDFTCDIHIEVPPRPNNQDGSGSSHFECKYCCLAVNVKSDKEWKKHILNDLQPYVCTFPHCDLTKHSFENKDAWYRHETQSHRLEYFCNTVGHSPSSDPAEFELHMEEEHPGTFDPAHTPLNIFQSPSSSKGTCNLCSRVTSNLKRHVSRHLEQVAVFALPRADFGASDDERSQGSNSNVAQYFSVGSQSLDTENDESETSSTPSSLSQHGPSLVSSMMFATSHFQVSQETPDNSRIPETDETDWGFLTEKFSLAREGDADIAPIAARHNHTFKGILLAVRACVRLQNWKRWTSSTERPTAQKSLSAALPNYKDIRMLLICCSDLQLYRPAYDELDPFARKLSSLLLWDVQVKILRCGMGLPLDYRQRIREIIVEWTRDSDETLHIVYFTIFTHNTNISLSPYLIHVQNCLEQPAMVVLDVSTYNPSIYCLPILRYKSEWPILYGLSKLSPRSYRSPFSLAVLSMFEKWFRHSPRPRAIRKSNLEGHLCFEDHQEYIAELLEPEDGSMTAVHVYPLVKKRFRRVGIAIWALMTLRQTVARSAKRKRVSPYHLVGVMLFWVQPGIDDANIAWTKEVIGLREVFRYIYHYDVWEPQLDTALPLLPQIRTFMDGYFGKFSSAGNLMIIHFEGYIDGRYMSRNAALYRAFLEVIHEYIWQSEADSILIVHAYHRIKFDYLLGPIQSRSKLRGSQILMFQSNSLDILRFSLDDWEHWLHDTTVGLSSQMNFVSETRGGKSTLYPSLEEKSNCIRLLPLSTNQSIKTLQSQTSLATVAEPVSSLMVCDICSKRIALLPEYHYHCRFCHRGDFDLCEGCIARGCWCLDESHQLVKRFTKPGRVIDPPVAATQSSSSATTGVEPK